MQNINEYQDLQANELKNLNKILNRSTTYCILGYDALPIVPFILCFSKRINIRE